MSRVTFVVACWVAAGLMFALGWQVGGMIRQDGEELQVRMEQTNAAIGQAKGAFEQFDTLKALTYQCLAQRDAAVHALHELGEHAQRQKEELVEGMERELQECSQVKKQRF